MAGDAAVPAVLVDPGPETRAELATAVRAALGGRPVRLADDALTRSSELSIERSSRRDSEGRLLEGRARGRPWLFRLRLDAGRCVLERPGAAAVELVHAHCAPQPTAGP
jgi:hypothetical protein